jgi:DNA-directed RNA polymerase alpha subunit
MSIVSDALNLKEEIDKVNQRIDDIYNLIGKVNDHLMGVFNAWQAQIDEINSKILSKDINSILFLPVADMNLSLRLKNSLIEENIYYIGDLVHITENDILKKRHLRKKSLTEIKNVLAEHGLSLKPDK